MTCSPEDVIVTNSTLGAAVSVAAGTLLDQQGNTFAGQLSITEVPPDLTPAVLPENLSPDLVVTVQPGEMNFTQPAALSLRNEAGWAPGTQMDLWSINPTTGDFEDVGDGIVSADGSTIETIEGGIRNSSWHFFAPPPEIAFSFRLADIGCAGCSTSQLISSEVELNTGGIIETHVLPIYQSLGESRGIQLTYDSLRADARHIVQLGGDLSGTPFPNNARIVAKMTVTGDGIDYEVPGFAGDELGLSGGEHFWSIPDNANQINVALQADLREFKSGVYDFSLSAGAYLQTADNGFVGSSSTNTGQLVHINTVNSAFGSGWGIAGVQELVEMANGSVLIIDGDGSELLFEKEGSEYKAPAGDFSILEKEPNGTFVRTDKDKTIYRFENNRLVSVKDRNDNITEHIYVNNQLSKIIDPIGLETSFTYENGRVSQITDPANRITKFGYDTDGNLTKIIDPDETYRTFEYDQEHHMTAEVNKRQQREEIFYDFAGRATHAVQKDGSIIQVSSAQTRGLYRPELTADLTQIPMASTFAIDEAIYVNANGSASTFKLDAAGQTILSQDGEGRQQTATRDSNNLVKQTTSGRNFITDYEYDDQGNIIRISDSISKAASESSRSTNSLFIGRRYEVAKDSLDTVSADFNNDGTQDLISFSNPNSTTVDFSALISDGKGAFGPAQNYRIDGAVRAIETGDFDNDGRQDFVTFSESDGYAGTSRATFYFGRGDGTFDEDEISINRLFRGDFRYNSGSLRQASVDINDIDGDGDKDIVVDVYSGGPVVLLNQGNRIFSSPIDVIAANSPVVAEVSASRMGIMSLSDINGDDFLDIVRTGATATDSQTGATTVFGLQVFINRQDGTFLDPTLYDLANVPGGEDDVPLIFTTADLNQDGFGDVIVSRYTEGAVDIFLGASDGSLTQGSQYVPGGRPTWISTAYINDDQILDLIVANEASNTVSIFQGAGDGSFNTPDNYNVGEFQAIYSNDDSQYQVPEQMIHIGDLNGDEMTDLAIVNNPTFSEGNTVSILLNQGDGTLGQAAIYTTGDKPTAILAKDFNGDGVIDLVISNNDSSELSVLMGQGDGTFFNTTEPSSSVTSISSITRDLKLADVNGDGLKDLVSISRSAFYEIEVRLNQGDSTFSDPTQYSTPGSPLKLAVGDFNDDGREDIVSPTGQRTSSNHLRVWTAEENGALSSSSDLTIGLSNRSIRAIDAKVGDFNGDENLDVLSYFDEGGDYRLSVHFGDGLGGFSFGGDFALTDRFIQYENLDVGDINGDGLTDIVFRDDRVSASNKVVDFLFSNGDGSFTAQPELSLSVDNQAPVTRSISLADLNGDGTLDLILDLAEPTGFSSDEYLVIAYGQTDVNGNALGTFGDIAQYELGLNRRFDDATVADINQDGNLDLLLSGYDLTVLLGEADGGLGVFKPASHQAYQPSNLRLPILLSDLDSDTDLDVIATAYSPDFSGLNLYLLENNSFSPGDGNDLAETMGDRTYTYDPVFNQLTRMTDELGRTTLYDIDPNTGNRRSMTQVVGEIDSAANGETDDIVTGYTYTSQGQLDIETDALDRETDYDYDAFGRLEQVTYAKGTVDQAIWRYEYDAAGNQSAVIDPNNRRTEYIYDALNRIKQITYAKGTDDEAVESFKYDDAGNQIEAIDANQNLTTTVYDEMNRAVQIIAADPDGVGPLESPVTVNTYDQAGNLASVIDPLGRETRYVYDSRNRLVKMILPDGSEETTRYDFDNNIAGRTDANGNEARSVYDARGRLVRRFDENGDETQFIYDAANQMIAQIDANGVRTEYTYDDLGRRTSLTTAAGTDDAITTYTEYDAVGNVIAQVDGLNQRMTMVYDNRDRLIKSIDAETPAGETIYTYDDAGNLLTLTDAAQNTTTFSYDARNRLTSETNQLGDERTHKYDDVGNRIEITDRNERTRTFTYDHLNRQVGETWLDDAGSAIRTATWAYDAAGQLTLMSDPDSTYSFNYDLLGRRIQLDNFGTAGVPNVVLDYGYDDDGNLISVTDTVNGVLGGTTIYSYDDEGRVEYMTQSGSGIDDKRVEFDYDKVGQIEEIRRYSDLLGNIPVVTTDYLYDNHNRLDRLSHSNSLGEVAFYDFAYDDGNRISQITDVDGVTDYSYNRRNELTGADHSDVNNPDETYSYDANGNRVSSSLHGSDYVTEANNRLTADGIYSYGYDDEGNMTSQTDTATGDMRRFEWDYLNRLVAVIDEDIAGTELQRVEYVYDGMNRRIAKIVDADGAGSGAAETLRFVYDRDDVLLEFENSDVDPSQRYFHGPMVDQVLAQEDGTGETLWHLSDHLGTVKDLVDDTGNVVNHRTYDSFGNLVAESDGSVESRYGFTGREFDAETGLHYYRARYYDGEIGRFISEDPLGFEGEDTNIYRYASNRPNLLRDPSGLKVSVGYRPFSSLNHPVLDGVADALLPAWHTTIILEPDEPCHFINHKYFRGFAGGLATLSGWPEGRSGYPFGALAFVDNAEPDMPWNMRGTVEVQTPANLSDTQFIRALIRAADTYAGQVPAPYFGIPARITGTYNSNSFVSGVIQAAGARRPNLPRPILAYGAIPPLSVSAYAPGYNRPLPIYSRESQDIRHPEQIFAPHADDLFNGF